MRKQMVTMLLASMIASGTAAREAAAGDRPGDFDYYVMSLSWSPNWCDREGDAAGSGQCAPRRGFGWVLHGLWPQNERGWPENCPAAPDLDPTRRESAGMADIMGSAGLAWHEWQVHGRCTGMAGPAYYELSRRAYDSVVPPEILQQLDHAVRLPAGVIEAAWLQANPALTADGITVTCDRENRIEEVRICLTRDLAPRRCSAEVRGDCTSDDALLQPIR